MSTEELSDIDTPLAVKKRKKLELRPMSITHPALALEFFGVEGRPERTAENTPAGAGARITWRCSKCEHIWIAAGFDRTAGNKTGCPACSGRVVKTDGSNSLARKEYASEFLYVVGRPDATIENTVAGVNADIGWCCSRCSYLWEATGNNRHSGDKGCPACAGRAIKPDFSNTIAAASYALEFRYVVDRTEATAKNTILGTNSTVGWCCRECSHSWEAQGYSRARNEKGCPACAGKEVKPDASNSISAAEYGSEFRYVVGRPEAKAENTVAGTSYKVGWCCSTCCNTWETSGEIRYSGGGCPKCNRNYTVSEHLSNIYLLCLLPLDTCKVDIETGKASTVNNPKGRPFQVDARIYTKQGLIAYLYDGGAGHSDMIESRRSDIKRRQALCDNVSFVVAHRHGMLGIATEVGASNYIEFETRKKGSVYAGARQLVQTINPEIERMPVDFDSIFKLARTTWGISPAANMLKFDAVLCQENRALLKEGFRL
jgi:rubrerythrin